MGADLYRWLRYAVPAGLLEIALGTWFLMDYLAAPAAYSAFPSVSEALVASAAVAAVLPAGYLLSLVAHQLAWSRYTRGRPLVRIDNAQIIEAIRRRRADPAWMAAADEAQQAAVIDVELYLHTSHPNWERAHARGRSLLDMAHGMGASFVGGATAFLVPLSIVMWSAVSDWDSVTSDRWVSLGVYLMVVGLLTTVVAMSQRRLAAVATQYLALLMEPLPTEPPDDA